MRFLLSRTDALGDLLISLVVQERILSRDPKAEVHWLVKAYTAPVLAGLPGVTAVHLREENTDIQRLISNLQPDAVLNLYHRDKAVTVAAKAAGVPVRVARARGLSQIFAATHLLWKGRRGSRRHEAQNVLDFLRPWHWDGGATPQPKICLSPKEIEQGQSDLAPFPQPCLGIVLRGSGSGACPSKAWWERTLLLLQEAGWSTVILSPAEESSLAPGDLRRLMARIHACKAILSPSTGPAHLAAALGIPLVVMMGKRIHHGPDRWAPLGPDVQILTYPGPEADLEGGMDRIEAATLISHLERLQ